MSITKCFSAMGLFTAAAIAGSASASTVWNVNIGNATGSGGGNEISTGDNYVGAATENTANSVWNPVSSTDSTVLEDSTGDDSAGVTFKVNPALGSGMNFGSRTIVGDEIFNSWMKDDGNNDAYSVTFAGLSTSPGTTYDLVVYSGWFWGPEGVHVALSEGTGLDGTFIINSVRMRDGDPIPSGVFEDTDPADVATNTNYARFDGLSPDGTGNLTLDINLGGDLDAPINGFQLVETVIPEPASGAIILVGLCALAARRRRG